MGTAALACLGFRANVMTAGMLGTILTPLPPVATFPPPPPLGVVPVEVDEEIDLVYLPILYIVVLGIWSLIVDIKKENFKETQCRYPL